MPPKRKVPDDAGAATNPSPPKRATRRANATAQPKTRTTSRTTSHSQPAGHETSKAAQIAPQPHISLPPALPAHLVPCLRLQQRVILSELQSPSDVSDAGEGKGPPTNAIALALLQDLLSGSVDRGEGNSCLLVGPRGSGKTTLVERAIKSIHVKPIVLRLSGYAQHNDRLALREVTLQLSLQTGKPFLSDADADAKPNPFSETGPSLSLPPPSHLPAVISVLPTLSRPVIVVLDAFDLFAQHARQSLLYCLLDTVQSCRVGQGNNGLAVIGVTTRVDTINLLEKRVKSRFSGRVLRTAPPSDFQDWMNFTIHVLNTPNGAPHGEWEPLWTLAVDRFVGDRKCTEAMKNTYALTRDIRSLKQLLTSIIVDLRPSSPFPTLSHVTTALSAQRVRQPFPSLHALSYPSICLLIAAVHGHTAGHDQITFEMLYDSFREQFRTSSAAPIQIEGGSIGMARCTRGVLKTGFEQLLAARIFTSVTAPSANVAPEFIPYRCSVERGDVKRAVDVIGQTNLKKWFNKAS
ncbi:origin recognition complex subunit 4 C-terminus-domain-containing protein [Phlebopus sp. FC_14]|nr:origin recognition complex subunit 4 C-terminus-domain-containing protein [Phlebopus sp. FC_14]